MGVILIIALTMTLLLGWRVDQDRHFPDVVGQMYSFWLLLSLAFALPLRHGAIDLSVWSVSALGGAAAVIVARAGGGPGTVLAAAAAIGAGIGAIHGILVGRLRVPSPLVTLVSALIVTYILGAVFEGRSISAPDGTFESWLGKIPVSEPPRIWLPWRGQPPFVLRMLLVVVTYLAVLGFALAIRLFRILTGKRREEFSSRLRVLVAMIGSGLLAGLGGAVWVVEHGSSPIPTRAIGDLRVVAAGVLGGAAFFAGPGRTILVILALPPSVLAATIWEVEVLHLPVAGHHAQVAVLIGMTVVTHLAMLQMIKVRRSGMILAAAGLALTLGGMGLLAGGTIASGFWVRRLLFAGGLVVWSIGAVLLILSRVMARRSARQMIADDRAP
jgi:ribose/xylose/arabinose/galactoside ABC-type transport system permease subunit